jgi:uncharacterized protein YktB (UPF0637 family)
VTRLGFTRDDFDVFRVNGFGPRMAKIYEHIRPKLIRLGEEFASELERKLEMEFHPHVAAHRRRGANPPPESWTAFGPAARGYKRYAYLALCISGIGIHARAVVKTEADRRTEMARLIAAKASELEKSFRGTRIARFDKWDFQRMPAPAAATAEFFTTIADELKKKTGIIDIGFGWPMREALGMDRAELLDAYRELEPFYRILRSVVV